MQQTSRVDRQERNLQLFHSWGWIKPSAGVVSSTNVEWDSHLKRLFYSWLVTWYVQIILYIELYVSVPAPKFLCQSAIFYLLLICFDTDVSIMLLHFLNAPINWQSHYYFVLFSSKLASLSLAEQCGIEFHHMEAGHSYGCVSRNLSVLSCSGMLCGVFNTGGRQFSEPIPWDATPSGRL